MATPAERKALLFFGLVAVLGAGGRLWSSRRPAAPDIYRSDSANASANGSGATPARRVGKSSGTGVRKTSTPSRRRQINRDSTSIVDLDRATMSEIDALGVLPAGLSRLIVADRDSFGPFGSLDELRRVPFLSASTLRKLAPRVTFSLVPRPRNTVVHPRELPGRTAARRKVGARP